MNEELKMPGPAPTLDAAQRKALKAQAHPLKPVVMIGESGLTPSVLAEIERALVSHELIKIRVFGDDREARATLHAAICEQTASSPVQHIGKLLVIWREKPADPTQETPPAAPRPRRNPPRLTKKAAAAKTDKAARARPLEKGKPRRPTRTR